MFAWMNQESLSLTIEKKQAVYYSRSRKKLWFKGIGLPLHR
jgi:phosphoribosyl-AMP cyclohydrolase